jgi:hypothetical protein
MTAVATIEPRQIVPNYGISDLERMAIAFAKSNLFGAKTPDQALALCLIAQAEGKHPAIAAKAYHIINGAPAKKADAMLADFQAAGGKVDWHEYTDACVSGTFSHPQGGNVRVDWDDARVAKAGLSGNPNHKKYPRAMKRARCISEGVRTVLPGATSGMYAPEEIQDGGVLIAEPTTARLTGAALLEQASDSPAAPIPSAAAEIPLTDAGQQAGAASNGIDKAAAWLAKYERALAECETQGDVMALQQAKAQALSDLASDRPELSERATAATTARYEALAGDVDGYGEAGE